jgi:Uma2 family endonuclease
MAEPKRSEPLTFEQVARLDPDREPGELDQGRFAPVTRNTWRHGEIVARVCILLGTYVNDHQGWSLAVGDPGTRLSSDPDTLRGPDVGLVRAERRPVGSGVDGWLEGAPDLAVEVCGDAQRWPDLVKKASEYLAGGGKMVWLLDPGERRVLVLTAPNTVTLLGENDDLDGGEVLAGFQCRVADLFG